MDFSVFYLGFATTAALVAFCDLKFGEAPLQAFLPALILSALFYLSVGSWSIFRLNLELDAVLCLMVVGLLYVTGRLTQAPLKMGTIDYLALMVFGLWPALLFTSIVGACLAIFATGIFKRRRFVMNLRLAGWLSLLVIPIGWWLTFM